MSSSKATEIDRDGAVRLWPYRPRPHRDESLFGYAARISDAYGFNSVRHLAKTLLGRQLTSVRESNTCIDQLRHEIAKRFGIPRAERYGCLDAPRDARESRRGQPTFKDISIWLPRGCPDCLAESGYFRQEWRLGHVIFCNHHRRWLLEVCPSCETPFDWRDGIMHGCPHCHLPWSALAAAYPSGHTAGIEQPALEDLRDLYDAFVQLASPGLLRLGRLTQIRYVPGVHLDLMRGAYAVLFDDATNAALAERAVAEFGGRGLMAAKAAALIRQRTTEFRRTGPENWPTAGAIPCQAHHEIGLHADILRLWNLQSRQTRPSSYLCADLLAYFLGLEASTVHALVENDCFPLAEHSRTAMRRSFYLPTIERLLEAIPRKAPGSSADLIDMAEATAVAGLWGLKEPDLVQACIQRDVDCWIPEDAFTPFEDIRISRQSLVAFGEAVLCRSPNRDLDRKTTADMLQVGSRGLDQISQMGLLPSKRWNPVGRVFELDTVREFLERHWIARRESLLRGVPYAEARERLRDAAGEVVLETVDYGRDVAIAKRTRRKSDVFGASSHPETKQKAPIA